jgi:hypothetical protein
MLLKGTDEIRLEVYDVITFLRVILEIVEFIFSKTRCPSDQLMRSETDRHTTTAQLPGCRNIAGVVIGRIFPRRPRVLISVNSSVDSIYLRHACSGCDTRQGRQKIEV